MAFMGLGGESPFLHLLGPNGVVVACYSHDREPVSFFEYSARIGRHLLLQQQLAIPTKM